MYEDEGESRGLSAPTPEQPHLAAIFSLSAPEVPWERGKFMEIEMQTVGSGGGEVWSPMEEKIVLVCRLWWCMFSV